MRILPDVISGHSYLPTKKWNSINNRKPYGGVSYFDILIY